MGEHLLFELGPIATGNDGHFDDAEKVVQQRRHFGIERRFTFGECAIQIVNNQLFHSGISISSTFTAPRGRKVHAPSNRWQQNHVTLSHFISGAAMLHLRFALDTNQHARDTRRAYGKRRPSAQTPQPEGFAVEESLALHGRRGFHRGRHQTACRGEIDAGKRLIDLKRPRLACLGVHMAPVVQAKRHVAVLLNFENHHAAAQSVYRSSRYEHAVTGFGSEACEMVRHSPVCERVPQNIRRGAWFQARIDAAIW